MANEIGKAVIPVEFDDKGLDSSFGGLESKVEGRFGKLGGVGGLALKAGLVGGAAAAAVGVGKYLFDIGQTFDDLEDNIATTTGKSGKALEGLVDVAKDVGASMPVTFEEAGEAVGKLSARTGLAGDELEDLASTELALVKITKGDLNRTIESSTRLFGDWGVSTTQQAGTLDKLFRATQATGVPVERLSELLVKFGGPLRQLGFGLEESAALFGKFEKEGVNTELVMGSMRIALGKFAREAANVPKYQAAIAKAQDDLNKAIEKGDEAGISKANIQLADFRQKLDLAQLSAQGAPKAIRAVFDSIKNAKTDTEGTSEALRVFGARAGPDMAAAIREGRFSVDDLVKTIKSGKGTIRDAERDTRDFSEQWQIFQQKVAVKLAPLAERLFAAFGEGMAFVNEEGPKVVAMLQTKFAPTFEAIGELVEELRPVFELTFKVVFNMVETSIRIVGELAEVVEGVVRLVTALLRGDWSAAWDAAKQIVSGVVGAVKALLDGLLRHIELLAGAALNAAKNLAGKIVSGIVETLTGLPGKVGELVGNVFEKIIGLGERAAGAGANLAGRLVTGLLGELVGLPGKVVTRLDDIFGAIVGLYGRALTAAAGLGKRIFDGIINALDGLTGNLATKILNAVSGAVTSIIDNVRGLAGRLGRAFLDALRDAIGDIGSFIEGLIPGPLRGLVKGAGGLIGKANPFDLAPLPAPSQGLLEAGGTAGPLTASLGGGGGLAGRSSSTVMGRLGQAIGALVPGSAGIGDLSVRVFIGDRELTDIVRVELADADTGVARTLLAGARL